MKREDFNVFIDLVEKSQFAKALTFLDELLKGKCNDVVIWYNRGVVLYDMKRYEESLISYNNAVLLDSQDPKLWLNRGNVLRDMTRYEESLKSYESALAVNSQYVAAWNNRGDVLNKMKRYEESLQSYEKGLTIDSQHSDAWIGHGIVLFEMKRYEEALQSYDNALALNPKDADAWYNRGVLLNEMTRYEESLKSYDNAVAINSQNAAAWNNRGIVLRKMKRYENSLKSYDKALAINFELAEAWNGKSNVYNDLDDHDEVLRCLIKLESIHSLHYRIKFWLKFVDEHDLPFLARRVICDYELEEYSSWKGLIERTVQRNAVVEKYLEYLDLSTAKERWGPDYWLDVALVHYYMGDPYTAYQLLDKNETGEYNNNFAWQYYLYKSAYAYHNKEADAIFNYSVEKAEIALSKGFADQKNAFYAGLLFFEAGDEQNAYRCFQVSRDYLPSKYMLLLCREHVSANDRKAIINQIVETEEKGQRDGGGYLYPIDEFYLEKNKEKSFKAIDKYATYKEIEEAVSELICHARDLKNENALKNSWEFILKTPETVKVYDAWQMREEDLSYIEDAIEQNVERKMSAIERELIDNVVGFPQILNSGSIACDEKISEIIFNGQYEESILEKIVQYSVYKKLVNQMDGKILLFYLAIKYSDSYENIKSDFAKTVFVSLMNFGVASLVQDQFIRTISPIVISPAALMLAGMVMKYFRSQKEEDIKQLTYRKLKNNIDKYLLTYKEENEELYNEIMSMSGGDKSNS